MLNLVQLFLFCLFLFLSPSAHAGSGGPTLYVSPNGLGPQTGTSTAPLSFSQANSYINQHPSQSVTFFLLPGNYGTQVLQLSSSNQTWKTFAGPDAVFERLEIQGTSPQVETAFLGFSKIGNIRSASVSLDNVFFQDVAFIGAPLSGSYLDPASYSNTTAIVMNANQVACVRCTIKNHLIGIVMRGVNFLIDSQISYISEDAIKLSYAADPRVSPNYFIFGNIMNLIGANHANGGHPDFIQCYANSFDSPNIVVAHNTMNNRLPNGTLAPLFTQGIHIARCNPHSVSIENNIIDTRHSDPSAFTGTTFRIDDSLNDLSIKGNTMLGAGIHIATSSGSTVQSLEFVDNIFSTLTKGNRITSDHTNYLNASGWVNPLNYISPLPNQSASYSHCEVEFAANSYVPLSNQSCGVTANASPNGPGYVGAVAPQ